MDDEPAISAVTSPPSERGVSVDILSAITFRVPAESGAAVNASHSPSAERSNDPGTNAVTVLSEASTMPIRAVSVGLTSYGTT